MTSQSIASLLYPPGVTPPPTPAAARSAEDLGLTTIARALDDGRHGRFIAGLLAELPTDPAIIRYRQDVIDELLRQPELAARIAAVMPPLREIAEAAPAQRWSEDSPLPYVASRLAELDCYVTCVEGLAAALEDVGALASAALSALRNELASLRAEPLYRQMVDELPQLRGRIDQAGSITIGVNLDPQLRPESATIIAINPARFSGRGTLLDRLLGERAAAETVRGITALFKAAEGQPGAPTHELHRDLTRLLERVAAPVSEALSRYTRLHTRRIAGLEPELTFYLGAVALVRRLRDAGFVLCRPEIAPTAERRCVVRQSYNLDLALRKLAEQGPAAAGMIVPSDIVMGIGEEIGLLTGPNSGGKTTYIRAIGQVQAMAQSGLPVAGASARVSPVDAIFTHFASAERLEQSGGRLAEELQRVAQIFTEAGPDSLILLNEPFTSTDHQSARVILGDILAGLRLLGARALVVTHLRELVADATDDQNGAGVVSLVAGVDHADASAHDAIPSFRIERGVPQSLRNATDLARTFGLDRAQLLQKLANGSQSSSASVPHQNGEKQD